MLVRARLCPMKIMIKRLTLLLALLICARMMPSWAADPLSGQVSQTEFRQGNDDAESNSAQKPSELNGNAKIERPSWIPLSAYTNEKMVCQYGNAIPFLRFGQAIPRMGADVYMGKAMAHYWRDGSYGTSKIRCIGIPEHPGNFLFFTLKKIVPERDKNGPNGWLQDTGEKSKDRWRIYRFWFAQ